LWSWAELVRQNNWVIIVAQKQPWMESDLLLAIREVDEVIHLREEIVVCGTLQVVGFDAMWSDTDWKHPGLGSNAFQAAMCQASDARFQKFNYLGFLQILRWLNPATASAYIHRLD
jgi:hypothetical protein